MQSNLHLKPKVRWDIIAPSFKMNQTKEIKNGLKKTKSYIQLTSKEYSNIRISSLFAVIIIALFSYVGEVKAYDFYYTYQGTTLCYDIDFSNTVTVVKGDNFAYTGDIIIPSQVTYNDTPYSVTSIGVSAFEGCSGLTSITIPNSVTYIAWSAFSGCSGLTSITIPNSVTSIGNSAFSNCHSLTSITIPNSVTVIGWRAFSSCSSLTSVTIPNSVTAIEDYTFSNCSSLTSITIPNSVTSIYRYVFYGCSSLDTITINSNSVCKKFWGKYDNVNPRVLIIGESVTSIVENAFDSCSSLVTIKIPASMTFIERYAFANCTNIDTIYSAGMCPPEVENTTSFKNVSRNAKLFVPSGSIEDYKQAKVWKEFFNIEEYNTTDSTADISDIDLSNTISLYPNPADKEVYLTLDNTDLGNAHAVIYDIQGKVVKTFEIKESEKSIKLDISSLQKGTYTIMISNDKTRVTKKLIKR